MSDSFMLMDKKYKVTLELLKILKFYNYPYIIFTRSDLVADDMYLEHINKDLAAVQFSISGNNETLVKKLEPGAPSVSRRLEALRKLNHHGIWTTVRVNPLFPEYPDGYYSDAKSIALRFGSKENCPRLELITPEFFGQLKDAGVPSLLAGFVRLSMPAINKMANALNFDFKSFFMPDLLSQNGDKRFTDKEIAVYYMKMKTEAAKSGIRFNTCYIGNGEKDYYQYQDLWDNKADCCDAKGNVGSIKTTSQAVPWSERMKHSPAKCVAEESFNQDKEMRKEYSNIIEKYRDQQAPLPELEL
jgi:DNA repair photolyase